MRMALWRVRQALLLWFASSPPPAVDAVGRILGLCGSSGGPLHESLHGALRRLAAFHQEKTTLRGFVEADGTSVRHFRKGSFLVYDQWYGMVQRAPAEEKGLEESFFSRLDMQEQRLWENLLQSISKRFWIPAPLNF